MGRAHKVRPIGETGATEESENDVADTHEQAALIARLIEPFPIHWVMTASTPVLREELARLHEQVSGDAGIYAQLSPNAANHLRGLVRLAAGSDPRGGTLRDQLLSALSPMIRNLVALAQGQEP